jgi:hypothetical protein
MSEQQSSADSAQPVAYRFNTHGDQRWRVVIDKPVPKAGVTAFDKIEALYLQPTRTEPQSLPTREEIAKAIGVALYGEDTFRSPDLNGWNLSAVLPAADATIALFARSQAVSAPTDLTNAIDAGIKACDLYEVAKEDVLRRSHLEQFLTAAVAALSRPQCGG